jgi:hypothetical protein
MSDSETQVTHDDVNTAFEDSRFLTETDDRLLPVSLKFPLGTKMGQPERAGPCAFCL